MPMDRRYSSPDFRPEFEIERNHLRTRRRAAPSHPLQDWRPMRKVCRPRVFEKSPRYSQMFE